MKYIIKSNLKSKGLIRILAPILLITGVFAFMILTAKPALAGGSSCDIKTDGGINSGSPTSPGGLKVRFLDDDGNPIRIQQPYELHSDQNGIAYYDASVDPPRDAGSYSGVAQKTCSYFNDQNQPIDNFDIWGYRNCGTSCNGYFMGNGFVLMCGAGNNHFRITGPGDSATIAPLAAGGGAGGGAAGEWYQVEGPNYRDFTIQNGTTPVITFRWRAFGTIYVSKYYPSTHATDGNFANQPAAVNGARVDLYRYGNTTGEYFEANTSNAWQRSKLPIGWNWFKVGIPTLQGYILKKVEITTRDFSTPDWRRQRYTLNMSCDSTYCVSPAFYMDPDTGWDSYAYVDLFYDNATPPAIGVICPAGSTKQQDKVFGYALDPTNTTGASKPTIKVKIDGANEVFAQVSTTKDANGNYPWTYTLPDWVHDNKNHSVTAFLIQGSTITQLDIGSTGTTITYGPSATNNCSGPLQLYQYPFLKTEKGNVVVNGEIRGQSYSSTRLGAPLDFNQYADYLVISSLGGTSQFCSTNYYILTNTNALSNLTSPNCDNGGGYGATPDYLFGTGSDKIYDAAVNKFKTLGSCAVTTNTPPTTIDTFVLGCPDGMMYQIDNVVDLPPLTVSKGRVTILAKSGINLAGNITLGSTTILGNSLENLKVLPNITIISGGNVTIKSSVTNIGASVYSKGYINTCELALPSLCPNQLTVKGSLSAKNGFILARVNGSNASGRPLNNPAELVSFSPLSAILSTPGTSIIDYWNTSSSVFTDPTEYAPRF